MPVRVRASRMATRVAMTISAALRPVPWSSQVDGRYDDSSFHRMGRCADAGATDHREARLLRHALH